jgi:hypothetical protein
MRRRTWIVEVERRCSFLAIWTARRRREVQILHLRIVEMIEEVQMLLHQGN